MLMRCLWKKCRVVAAVVGAGLWLSSIAHADPSDSNDLVDHVQKSFLTGDLGVTFVSEYIPRGVVAENQGLIAQPYIDLNFQIYEGTGFFNYITLQLGLFSVLTSHVQPEGSTDTTRNWFEFDINPALFVGFAKNWVLSLKYISAYSPADAFRSIHAINGILSYNDSDLLGAWALHPHLTILRELSGALTLEPNGWYYEAGILPSYVVAPKSRYPVTLTLPITLGLGSAHFYRGNTFGYVSGGPSAAFPLAFIPKDYGSWTVTLGYLYYRIGPQLAEALATGHRNQHQFTGGIGLTF